MKPILTALVAAILTIAAAASSSAENVLRLDHETGSDVASVSRHMEVMFDPDQTLTIADVSDPDRTEWERVQGKQPDFGYRPDVVWLRIRVENPEADAENWVVHFHDNFKQLFDTYVVYDTGEIAHVLATDRDTTFSQRPMSFPHLAAPFVLKAGEKATLYVRFWSEGSSLLPTDIKSLPDFLETTANAAARNFVFYGLMAAFIVAALAGSVVFSSITAVAFAAYSGIVLLFVMHADGTGFQYIYPNAPRFNSYASVVWGGGFIFFSALYARIFLQTRPRFPKLDIALIMVMLATVSLGAAMFFADPQTVKKSFVTLALIGMLTCLGSGLIVARTHFREVRFYILAWTGAVASSLLMNLIHIFGFDLSSDVQTNSMRAVMVVDAGLMGLAILDRYAQMRDSGQRALRATLATSERNLSLSRRLSELEQQIYLLESVSRQKDEVFANAIHDLRQPLHALRLRVRTEASTPETAGGEQHETDQSFVYMEALISQYLDEMRNAGNGSDTPGDGQYNAVSLAETLSATHEMFAPDAARKGLEFRFVPTHLTSSAEPLAVMRIVSNLVGNAIKYTDQGRILMGCRLRDGQVVIEVHDTGPGLSEEDFQSALRRDVRLAQTAGQTEGEGFGLAIANDFAKAHGGRLKRVGWRRKGLGVAVYLPAGPGDT